MQQTPYCTLTLYKKTLPSRTIYINIPKYETLKGQNQRFQVDLKQCKMLSRVKSLEEKLKALQGIYTYKAVITEDLLLFPNIVILTLEKAHPSFTLH